MLGDERFESRAASHVRAFSRSHIHASSSGTLARANYLLGTLADVFSRAYLLRKHCMPCIEAHTLPHLAFPDMEAGTDDNDEKKKKLHAA
jgi:hypothetical protein